MPGLGWILGCGVMGLFWIGLILWIRHTLEASLQKLSAQAFQESFPSMLDLAKRELEEKRALFDGRLADTEGRVAKVVEDLRADIERARTAVKDTEKDRIDKFSKLSTLLERVDGTMDTLTESTGKWRDLLTNNRLRGQWGERMAEDLLRSSGLEEPLNYVHNTQQQTVGSRPDYTFFLPENRRINMDVKFPLDNLLKAQEAKEEAERTRYLKEFVNNAKDRIREVAGREYVNPEEGTVDYAILFVPNESVYALIHQHCADLFDVAEKNRVVLAAPFSLLAILKIIHEAVSHFHFQEEIQKISKRLEQFNRDYALFKERFQELQEKIQAVSKTYSDISETSFKRLDRNFEEIEKMKKGKLTEVERDT